MIPNHPFHETAFPRKLLELRRPSEAFCVLRPPNGLGPSDPVAIARAVGHLRVVFLRDGKLFEQTYDRDGVNFIVSVRSP